MTADQVKGAAAWLQHRHGAVYGIWSSVLRLDIEEELVLAGLSRLDSVHSTSGLALAMHRALLDKVGAQSRRKADVAPSDYDDAELNAEIQSQWDKGALGAFTDHSCPRSDTIIDALALDDAMQRLHPEWRALLVDLDNSEALTADQRRRRSSIRRYLELAVEGDGRKIGSYVEEPVGIAKQPVHSSELLPSWPV